MKTLCQTNILPGHRSLSFEEIADIAPAIFRKDRVADDEDLAAGRNFESGERAVYRQLPQDSLSVFRGRPVHIGGVGEIQDRDDCLPRKVRQAVADFRASILSKSSQTIILSLRRRHPDGSPTRTIVPEDLPLLSANVRSSGRESVRRELT